jgi:hypothetical protein
MLDFTEDTRRLAGCAYLMSLWVTSVRGLLVLFAILIGILMVVVVKDLGSSTSWGGLWWWAGGVGV